MNRKRRHYGTHSWILWRKNNWNGMLYTYEEIHRKGEKFYIEFERDGRKHWFHGYVGAKEQAFNPPLATPMNQSSI